MLTFDEEKHLYKWRGRIVPSVTQVLREWIPTTYYGLDYIVNSFTGVIVPAERFREAADFGSAVHMGAKLIVEGMLDWDALDASLVPPLRQFERFLIDHKVQPVLVEVPLYSTKHDYAGTPDLVFFNKRFNQSVCDIKTGEIGLVGPQTAAYENLYREHSRYGGRIKRFVLRLPKDGSEYKLSPLTGRLDFNFFMARRFQYQFITNHTGA